MNRTHLSLNQTARAQLVAMSETTGRKMTHIVEDAIGAKWRSEYEINFNRACTEMGVTADREAFHTYWLDKRDSAGERHSLATWEIIYRCFESSRDERDERDTLEDALQ